MPSTGAEAEDCSSSWRFLAANLRPVEGTVKLHKWQMAFGRAPGLDGLPSDYKRFWGFLGDRLTTNVLSEVLSLILKKGDLAFLSFPLLALFFGTERFERKNWEGAMQKEYQTV